MENLHSHNILHRDLACRNVLVAGHHGHFTGKIADFGLSRKTESFYKIENKTLPVRWCAPEVTGFGKASKASDVWAFGVVLYEIFSRGAIPYAGMSNLKVIQKVKQGYRLSPPPETPEDLRPIMKACWQVNESDRPTFAVLSKQLNQAKVNSHISFMRSLEAPAESDEIILEPKKEKKHKKKREHKKHRHEEKASSCHSESSASSSESFEEPEKGSECPESIASNLLYHSPDDVASPRADHPSAIYHTQSSVSENKNLTFQENSFLVERPPSQHFVYSTSNEVITTQDNSNAHQPFSPQNLTYATTEIDESNTHQPFSPQNLTYATTEIDESSTHQPFSPQNLTYATTEIDESSTHQPFSPQNLTYATTDIDESSTHLLPSNQNFTYSTVEAPTQGKVDPTQGKKKENDKKMKDNDKKKKDDDKKKKDDKKMKENDKKMKENDKKMKDNDKKMKDNDKKMKDNDKKMKDNDKKMKENDKKMKEEKAKEELKRKEEKKREEKRKEEEKKKKKKPEMIKEEKQEKESKNGKLVHQKRTSKESDTSSNSKGRNKEKKPSKV